MKFDIIVVGGGPAGMTAALYATRAGKRVLLLEGGSFGGQIVNSQLVENYPGTPDVGGWELADRMLSQIRALEVETLSARAVGIEKNDAGFLVKTDSKGDLAARAVILATGVGHRKLGVAGEEALIGRGVSFCATCDGMFFRRREVAVVGGGNTAVQDALVLAEFCSKVYLIHRRDGFRAEERLLDRMHKNEGIEVITDTVVEEMRGEGRLESLILRNVKSGETRELAVAGVFEAIGNLPQNAAFADLVALDEEGYILADDDCRTSCDGIFAAGDCRRKRVRQLTTAAADGTVAALAAVEYIEG
jgi:thioredoxin reductase (NADPH)